MGQRDRSADVFKGLIIAVIVLIHLLVMVPENIGKTVDSGIFVQFLYTGLMFFFIIAGYYYKAERKASANIKRRIIQIGIPLVIATVIFPLILLVYLTALGQNPDPNGYWSCLKNLIGGNCVFEPFGTPDPPRSALYIAAGYYFLQIMIVAFIIFYPAAKHVLDDKKKLALSIFILLLATALMMEFLPFQPPLWLHYGPLAAAFMLFGAFLSKKNFVHWIETYEIKTRRYWLTFFAALAIGVVMTLAFPPSTNFVSNIIGDYGGWSAFPFFITCCATNVFFFFMITWFMKIPVISNVLEFLGKHTLGILILHVLVIKLMIAPFYNLNTGALFPSMPIWVVIIVWIAALVICTLVSIYGMKAINERMGKKKNISGSS